MKRVIRPYQDAALDSVPAGLAAGQNRFLWKMPTGTGKTFTFAQLPKRLSAFLEQFPPNDRKMLVIAHREELLDQAAATIQAENPELLVMVEQGDRRAGRFADVVIASVQTLAARKFARLRTLLSWITPRIVVVDECHHAAASTYRTSLAHLGFLPKSDVSDEDNVEAATQDDVEEMVKALAGWDALAPKDRVLLGVTATPNRSDAVGLGCVFQSIAYSYDLKKAIEDGWLVSIVPWAIETATSLDNVHIARGDFNQRELADAVNNEQRNLLGLAAWHQYAKGRPTIGFTVDVAHAHALTELYEGAGVRSAAISGETPKEDRRLALRQYSEGQIDALFNCMVLTEGTDLPRTSCIIHYKPTKSATLYEQMCLDSETEILTRDGWKGIRDDIAGIQVAAFNLGDGSVNWSAATRIERPRGRERMWGLASPHLDIRVTGGHRMVIRTRSWRPWHIKPAEAMPSECTIPLCGEQAPCQPWDPITDDEVTFLGLLLTDGSLSKANGAISLFQSERYPAVIELIERTLQAMQVKYTHSVSTKPSNFGPRSPLHRWTISKGQPRKRDKFKRGWGYLSRWVSDNAKTLTDAYEGLGARQVALLLEAMHAGDGTKTDKVTEWLPQSLSIAANKTLADQVQSLAVRRGIRCNISPRTDRLVMLHISLGRSEWGILRKAADARPVWGVLPSTAEEMVWCVTVDTGAIITRRNGKVAVVGNTGRGLRLFEGKQDCVVIDLVDVARRHSLQAAPVLYGLPPSLTVKGKPLAQVSDEFDQLVEKSPNFDLAAALEGKHLTLEQLGALASKVDIWSVPTLGDFGQGRAVDWIKVSDVCYRVQYPWGDGYEHIDVLKDLIDKWEVVLTMRSASDRNAPKRQRTIATQIHTPVEAANMAEQFISSERRSVLRLKGVDAAWKSAPASDAQRAALMKRGAPPSVYKSRDLTKGRASQLLDVASARRTNAR